MPRAPHRHAPGARAGGDGGAPPARWPTASRASMLSCSMPDAYWLFSSLMNSFTATADVAGMMAPTIIAADRESHRRLP
jgi:hypothetical protein